MKSLQVFIAVVETGSFSAAARLRKISQPAISQKIVALEKTYGAILLHRGRNGVRMTKAGEILFRHAQTIVQENEKMIEALDNLNERVAGQLKVTTHIGLSQFIMGDVLVELSRTHPDLRIVLSADDRMVDMISEGFDIALRTGNLGEENVVGRRVGTLSGSLVATPAYLDRVGRPTEPEQLIDLDYIQYRAEDDAIATPLQRGSEVIQVPIKTSLTAQLPDLVLQALLGNLGYAKAPYFISADKIASGELEEVLPEWKPIAKDMFLVYPHRETQSKRLEAFLQTLFTHLDRAPGIDLLPSIRRTMIKSAA